MPDVELSNSGSPELSGLESVAADLAQQFATNADSTEQPAGEDHEDSEAQLAAEPGDESAEAAPEAADDTGQSQDQAAEPNAQGEAEKPGRYTVKVGDKEERLSLDDLKSGYMRTADYTQKTQKFADERKAAQQEIETARTELQKRVSEDLTRIEFLANKLLDTVATKEKATDWEHLRVTDPAEYAARRAELDQQKHLLAASYQEYLSQTEQAKRLHEAKLSQELPRMRAEAEEQVKSRIPEWVDLDRANREKPEIAKFLTDTGYSKEEISSLMDPRAVQLARKAWLFEKLMARKTEVQKKAEKPVQRVTRGGAAGDPGYDKSKALSDRFRKSGDTRDLGALLAESFMR